MHPQRQRKIIFILFMITVLAIVTALVMYALRQNISLFYTPSQLAAGDVSGAQTFRLGGMVVKGSIKRNKADLSVEFALTDFKETVHVMYRGILPDLFREGQGIVAMGTRIDNRHFKASQVLAKHDANYMPPEVKEALAQASQSNRKGE